MNNLHVKKGDSVIVIAGSEKGKTGVITAVNADKGTVVIDGVNLATHFVKPRSAQEQGGIITKPAPIDASNVQLVCSECGKQTRAGHKIENVDGKDVKIRICKKCGASLEVSKSEAKKTAKKTAKKSTKTAKKAKAE